MGGYRWEPGVGLYAVDRDRVVGVLEIPGPGGLERQRLAVARRMLREAEASRHGRRRPPAMLDRMAAAFAADRLGGPAARDAQAPVTLSVEEVLAWVDGPGLDVILDFVLTHRPG